MNKISFDFCNNVFLDNGIIGVYEELKEFEKLFIENNKDIVEVRHLKVVEGNNYKLSTSSLEIEHDYLFELLEELYYKMGSRVYDTATLKQEENKENLYFSKDGSLKGEFPKMNTYGFTELLTNNAQGVSRNEEDSQKIADIEKSNIDLANKIKSVFEEKKIKLLSKVYFERPYTKITRLEKPTNAHFEEGQNTCFLTGKNYKKLVDAQNISPFLSGLNYFDSMMSSTNRKVSWSALYLSRFSAGMCLYVYPNKLRESLNIYFFHSDSLTEIYKFYEDKLKNGVMKLQEVIKSNEFLANFPRNENTELGKSFDYINTHEVLLYILHHVYISLLDSFPNKTFLDILSEEKKEFRPISITAIRAESFAATMRPVQFEVITHFYTIMYFFYSLEQQNISLGEVLSSLKLLKPSKNSPNNEKRWEQERQLREVILKKIFNGKSITDEIEYFYLNCLNYSFDILNDPQKKIGWFKQYKQVFEFYNFYENHISQMSDSINLRTMALGLGAQIGQAIINYSVGDNENQQKESSKKDNAKRGRKYIIRLKKANKFDDFLAQIANLQSRYGLGIKKDFLENIAKDDFLETKQFIIISMLNQINPVLINKKQENDEAK